MRFKKISRGQWYKDYFEHDNVTIADILYDGIKLPRRATSGSAGYDFFAPYDITIPPNNSVLIPTGIRWISDENINVSLLLYPRSGLGFKHGIRLMNSVGVIDGDYYNSDNEGHIMLKLYNPSNLPVEIPKGKGVVQGIITPYYTCDNDRADKTRNGGFGSTDIY